MPAAESVINCPICNNAMIFEGKGGGYCPSCQPPAPSTALDDLVAAADEIAYQYQPLRFYGWPALAVIEEQWLEKLDAALEAWRASPESTV